MPSPEQSKEPLKPPAAQSSNWSKNSSGANVEKRSRTSASASASCFFPLVDVASAVPAAVFFEEDADDADDAEDAADVADEADAAEVERCVDVTVAESVSVPAPVSVSVGSCSLGGVSVEVISGARVSGSSESESLEHAVSVSAAAVAQAMRDADRDQGREVDTTDILNQLVRVLLEAVAQRRHNTWGHAGPAAQLDVVLGERAALF